MFHYHVIWLVFRCIFNISVLAQGNTAAYICASENFSFLLFYFFFYRSHITIHKITFEVCVYISSLIGTYGTISREQAQSIQSLPTLHCILHYCRVSSSMLRNLAQLSLVVQVNLTCYIFACWSSLYYNYMGPSL